jgi:hypothetical protein
VSFGEDLRSTLVPGILIESENKESGTLGCFARLKSDNSAVLLSARHVLFAKKRRKLDVGQPDISCSWCCKCHVIGETVGDGRNGVNHVDVEFVDPVDGPGTADGSEIDCAIARLKRNRPFSNEIFGIGMITGTPPPGDFGVVVGSEVEKTGTTTGHTKGVILETIVTTQNYKNGPPIPRFLFPIAGDGDPEVDAPKTINQFFIMPKPGFPKCADEGDSGAVVVNSQKQVIGLITNALEVTPSVRQLLNLPPHVQMLGKANPIHTVMTALNIEIPPNFSGTKITHGELIDLQRDSKFEDEEVLEGQIVALRRQLEAMPLGKVLLQEMDTHRREVLRLVNQNRRVGVAWQRQRGPAFAAHCFKSFREPDHVVPKEIEGITRSCVLKTMAEVLKTYGSEPLREMIEVRLPVLLRSANEFDDLKSFLSYVANLKDE